MRKKVLVFCDAGIDDAIALIYAHYSGQIELVGIVSDYGNVPGDYVLRNVHYLLSILGLQHVLVFEGAKRPMTGIEPAFSFDIMGSHGLGPIVPPEMPMVKTYRFCEIHKLIEHYKHDLSIICTGPLTSLASLFLFHGEVADLVNGFHVMGGAFMVPGNSSPAAEANFFNDPYAVNLVFRYAKKLTLFPLNVTMRALVTPEMTESIHFKGKSRLIKPLLEHYYSYHKKVNPAITGIPIHDLPPFMALIHPQMFSYMTLPVEMVVDKGVAFGQSIADFRVPKGEKKEEHFATIALNMDKELFDKDFMRVMT
ncbi:nucleoside hydrolase [Cohnella sp. CFH 77786]|uniref:nucleoside hydrolase n=1 Tax=Cohnella sp. CFH 77786 TaxID=2662265 RepID=UPI001C60AC6A|nr:nucleoside hydrolase [Cohnella sp. CFH 77786]